MTDKDKGQSAGDVGDKIKDATQPGDSKTTAQKLSETVQQGVESAKQTGEQALKSAQETVSKTFGGE
ncbi:hypothetical protein FQN55_001995 [Onygenales sp. PD_40]|nr:hypothetical protein FQN55_001995 [Onygenales sp. PD_40]KAK2775458.1 hypothetical protein FQN53_003143 [Emmonsiellopsis sp. PD_33]KAK2794827.1 hypothetical protein FQN51_000650 [Onygenales sp. PD_10]KAK2795683.1 hypothetical protein FQN52_003532 [Onygenales sp. PD_12]